ncbi:MAG: carboxymuconolactone decarboxylase family protein [Rhodospirillales bacterium]|nr:carboxymuconolactone decarboxylase family protein [Rhodospirillales bacterium]
MIATMKKSVAVLTFVFGVLGVSTAHASTEVTSLTPKEQSIITIAAFTASGEMEKLKGALNTGLDAGLTVNETKEILVQMYAYAGFPRSLNGIFALMGVLKERESKGITDEVGREASPVPADLNRDEYGAKVRAKLSGLDEVPPPSAWQTFSPVIDTFLKEHLFADIFVRDVLDHQQRELATIGALANLPGTGGQLRYHLGAAMNTGISEAQMKDFIVVLKSKVGVEEGEAASALLSEVLKKRAK